MACCSFCSMVRVSQRANCRVKSRSRWIYTWRAGLTQSWLPHSNMYSVKSHWKPPFSPWRSPSLAQVCSANIVPEVTRPELRAADTQPVIALPICFRSSHWPVATATLALSAPLIWVWGVHGYSRSHRAIFVSINFFLFLFKFWDQWILGVWHVPWTFLLKRPTCTGAGYTV